MSIKNSLAMVGKVFKFHFRLEMFDEIKRAVLHPSHSFLFLLIKTAILWPDKLFLKLKFRLV